MIGYVMVIYDREEQTYNIWHFMIDAAHQRKGYGKAALAQVIRYIKTKAVWAVRARCCSPAARKTRQRTPCIQILAFAQRDGATERNRSFA